MSEGFDSGRFWALLPRFLQVKEFREAFKSHLDHIAREVISAIDSGEEIPEAYRDFVHDAAEVSFGSAAKGILCLEWDGGFPGMAGATWISTFEGVYIVTSTDYSAQGPFESLEEALDCDCFGVTTANPGISSDELPLEKLLKIAAGVVDWENEGEIWINSDKYFARNGELVREDAE